MKTDCRPGRVSRAALIARPRSSPTCDEGALAYDDSGGRSGVDPGGRVPAHDRGPRPPPDARRTRRGPPGHTCFKSGCAPSEAGLEPGHEQKRFSAAERRGGLCVVASPDARRGSLRLHQDALLYSAMLDPGKHVVHELGEGRSAWLHLVEGEATLGDVVLTSGDGAGLTAERAVSLTAREETEILLVDLGAERPRPPGVGGAPR